MKVTIASYMRVVCVLRANKKKKDTQKDVNKGVWGMIFLGDLPFSLYSSFNIFYDELVSFSI